MGRVGWQLRLAELAQPYLSKVPAGLLREAMLDRLVLSRPLYDKLAAKSEPRRIAPVHVGPQRPAPITRLAIALLVQNPSLARLVTDLSAYQGLELPGMNLFETLVGLLSATPALNTAAIVEHFRGTEYEHSIAKIATWTHSVLEQDIEAEFRGVLAQLRRTALKEKIEALLQKEKVSGLTSVEKRELADLTRLPVAATPVFPGERR
jgi:DNA primase